MKQQTHHSKKATAKKQPAVKNTAAKGTTLSQQEKQSAAPEERYRMIAEVAYFIAEQRGFQGDMALDDWLQAEAEVAARVAARH